MGNIVAIVGRPNVGKSTLFNRLTQTRQAIVHESSGVTRDRHYGKCIWNGIEFSLIDTGGYIQNSEDIFEEEIRKQVILAIEECDSILFVVDVENGVTDLDDAVAHMMRQSGKPVKLVANKVDNNERLFDINEFYTLGLGDPFPVSSINGSGTGDLLDSLTSTFIDKEDIEEPEIPRFAIVGRPNVGKSSLINSLLGEDRNIVTPISGTTRDSIHTRYNKFGLDFYLVDTAGVRKKSKVHENIEFYSVMRSVRAIEYADVCLLLIDAVEGVKSQDISIFGIAQRNHKGIVILVNKWDLVEKDTKSSAKFLEELQHRIAPFTDVPVIFTSALTKQRVLKALETAVQVYQDRSKKIQTSKLNDFLQEAVESNPPPSVKGKFIRIKYATQLPNPTPIFAFYCNRPQYIKDPYKRYLENKIREKFDFTGVPIRLFFRKK
ncbi:MAG: ribosome biogenesis GTPase Der [Bacteroidetes bacterium]|jgi:GTPase|nr:ribosome biogenesis GTPase Der [Bacteroidota bacterium]MBT3749604.1 ribosome biogenesis GTPase Der [Bacteroidota bacterium]MBT4401698.1 ribosome biogenesis GTPase Der [Bacteroidota bacterium]MBT4411440.1 ribosome biogenesis GTPase Der [Bacteroidota bacterium]MBT7093567.1 ribosome biogenesis GTPase Der [Bacteroidota bacterium]